jgi:hypothetical protein
LWSGETLLRYSHLVPRSLWFSLKRGRPLIGRESFCSVTIGVGVSDPLNGNLDLDGLARSAGQRTDIGAYELQPPAAPQPMPTPPDTTAPKTKIGRLTLSRRGIVTFKLTCPANEARCRWSYSLRSAHRVRTAKRAKGKVLKLGAGKASAAGGNGHCSAQALEAQSSPDPPARKPCRVADRPQHR